MQRPGKIYLQVRSFLAHRTSSFRPGHKTSELWLAHLATDTFRVTHAKQKRLSLRLSSSKPTPDRSGGFADITAPILTPTGKPGCHGPARRRRGAKARAKVEVLRLCARSHNEFCPPQLQTMSSRRRAKVAKRERATELPCCSQFVSALEMRGASAARLEGDGKIQNVPTSCLQGLPLSDYPVDLKGRVKKTSSRSGKKKRGNNNLAACLHRGLQEQVQASAIRLPPLESQRY